MGGRGEGVGSVAGVLIISYTSNKVERHDNDALSLLVAVRGLTFCTVLIYDLAKQHLVEDLKYPPGLAELEYDKDFAIMVRHFQQRAGTRAVVLSVLFAQTSWRAFYADFENAYPAENVVDTPRKCLLLCIISVLEEKNGFHADLVA